MRSRAARFVVAALAIAAIAGSAAFLYRSEKQIALDTLALRAFDLHAREATDALADLRAAQQAYVAAGQGVTFWMPKVASTTDAMTTAIRSLRQAAASSNARAALDQAAMTITDFANVDSRARDYLRSGQQLMAGDVIFTEGAESAATAAREVEGARLAEHQAFDQTASQSRRQEAMALGGATAVGLLALLLLIPLPSIAHEDVTPAPAEGLADESSARIVPNGQKAAAPRAPEPAQAAPAPEAPVRSAGPILRAAADLATDVGRARDYHDLERLIGRVADMMDASGVVLWVGNTSGADLRAVLAYGYSPQVLSRMPSVPRSGDNAAAAAYRTASLQIVLSRPGGTTGGLVAPILTADGCVGALSAEIRHGGEASESVQALAMIFAAQLASVIAPAAETAAPETKTASA